MARSIIGVIVGYLVMFGLAFIAFTCAFLILGAEVVFKPGMYESVYDLGRNRVFYQYRRCDYRRNYLCLNSEGWKIAVSVGDPGGCPGTPGCYC